MSVGASSINRVSKQSVDTTKKNMSATQTKKKANTATRTTEKTQPAQKIENGLESKIYCLTDELPIYLL